MDIMKFVSALCLLFIINISVFTVTSAQNWNELVMNIPKFQNIRNQQKRSQTNCKFPLFSCRLLNKFRSTKRQTGFQGTSQPNQVYSYDPYSQASSSSYPSYAVPFYRPNPSYVQNYYPNSGQQNSVNEYPMASAASAPYASHAPPATSGSYTAQSYGSSPNTIDVHQVLDQFIRSAGLSPQGDHEAQASHASSFAKAGTSPVFVFKKLFSFPFYMSADPNIANLYGKNWK